MGASLNFKNSVKRISVDGELDASYSNVQALLTVLGYSVDSEFYEFEGNLPEFIAALERFKNSEIASVVDGGTETITDRNFISCGRSEGYFARRVETALQLSREALSKGATEFYFS